jgi:hypothetical protein
VRKPEAADLASISRIITAQMNTKALRAGRSWSLPIRWHLPIYSPGECAFHRPSPGHYLSIPRLYRRELPPNPSI